MARWVTYFSLVIILLTLIIGLEFFLIKTRRKNLNITQQFEENNFEVDKTICNFGGTPHEVDKVFLIKKDAVCSVCKCLFDETVSCVLATNCPEGDQDE